MGLHVFVFVLFGAAVAAAAAAAAAAAVVVLSPLLYGEKVFRERGSPSQPSQLKRAFTAISRKVVRKSARDHPER